MPSTRNIHSVQIHIVSSHTIVDKAWQSLRPRSSACLLMLEPGSLEQNYLSNCDRRNPRLGSGSSHRHYEISDPPSQRAIMDEEIDPEIARQMGFASFGGGGNKRRKLATADDAITDVQPQHHDRDVPQRPAPSGANATPVGDRAPEREEDLPLGLGIYGTRTAPSMSFPFPSFCGCRK